MAERTDRDDRRSVGPQGSEARHDRQDASQFLQPLRPDHLNHVVVLFREVFPDNPLSRLGHTFLRKLLSSYVTVRGGCGYVCVKGDEVAGFVVGSENSRRHHHDLVWRHGATLLGHALLAVLASPSHIWPFVRYLRSYALPWLAAPGREAREDAALPLASLVFLGVAPRHRRGGVATALTEAFLQQMSERGVERVKLVVAVANREALQFYLVRGWRESGRYPSPMGGLAYRLIYDLAPGAATSRRGCPPPAASPDVA